VIGTKTTIMASAEEEEDEKLQSKIATSGDSPKKRKSRGDGDEDEADTAARERQEQRRKANDEKDTGEATESAKDGNEDDDNAGEDKPDDGEDSKPSAHDAQAQNANALGGGVNNAPFAAALGANPFLTAGMPLASITGLDHSSPQGANFNPFLFAHQQGFAYGMPMMNPADQSRLIQNWVANRAGAAPNEENQEQQQDQLGQQNGAPEYTSGTQESGGAQTGQGQVPAAMFPSQALQQLYQHGGGMDAAQMMMMGMQPNPYLLGIRPELIGTAGRLAADAPLASVAASNNLYRSPSIPLGLPCDDEHLSEYQMLVRQQLEIFEAEQDDVDSNTQGRKKPVVLGQAGLRCRHCAGLPLRQRGKGSVYYPTKLTGIYQAAQNMASSHLADACQCIDDRLKVTLITLRQRRDTASGGKQYWADGAKIVGLYETEDGLRLNRQFPLQQPPEQF